MTDELRGIPNDLIFPPGGTIPPAPPEPPLQQSYQMQPDPMYAPQPMGPPDLPSAETTPDQGGSGGIGSPDWQRIGLTLEGFGAGIRGQEPLFLKLQKQRDLMAVHQATIAEQQRQHDIGLIEKVFSGNQLPAVKSQMLEELSKQPNFSMAKQSAQLAKVFKDQDYDSFDAYKQFIPGDVQQRFAAGTLPQHELSAWVDLARKATLTNAQEDAKSRILSTALNKPADQRTAHEAQLVEEHVAKTELQRADIDWKKAQAEKARMEAQRGPVDHSVLNRVHEQVSGGLPFEQGTPASQQKALDEYWKGNAQGRTNVMLATPPSGKEQADYYTMKGLENLDLEQAPRGLSEGAYRTGPYRQLDEKEKDALVQYKVAEKTVATMNRVADALITAKTPGEALKQKAKLELGALTGRNGLAAAYKADKASFSSRMARLVEVGVLTNTDVTRWEDTFGSFGDTVKSLKAKQALFGEIQDETRVLLKLRLGGKPVTAIERTKLDTLLDKTNQYRPIDEDLKTLGIP